MKIQLTKFVIEQGHFGNTAKLTHLKAMTDSGNYIKFAKITPEILAYIQDQIFEVPEDLIK